MQFCVHGHVWFHDLVENMLSVFASTHQRVLLTFIFRPVSSADGIYPDFSREDEEGEEDSFKRVLT